MERMRLLSIKVDNLTMDETVDRIDSLIINGRYNYVVTPNTDHIIKLENDMEFKKAYDEADIVLTDGMPLIWISRLKGNPIKERISGADLFPKVCELANRKAYKLFLLGADEGVAEKAVYNLKARFRELNVVGVYSPYYGFENDEVEIGKIIKMVNNANPDILAVGLGAPKQEKFIYKYKDALKIPVTLAIGAAIDFEAGKYKRAPKWVQVIGMEWFYRMCQDPRRLFKRYLIDDLKIIKLYFKYN